jgi:hypothetical protein
MTEALRVGLFSSHASMTSEKGSMMEDLSLAFGSGRSSIMQSFFTVLLSMPSVFPIST